MKLGITPGGGFAAGPSINFASSSGDILSQMYEDNARRGMSSFVFRGRRSKKTCDLHSKGVAIVKVKQVSSSERSGDFAGTGRNDGQTQVTQRRKPYSPRHGLIFPYNGNPRKLVPTISRSIYSIQAMADCQKICRSQRLVGGAVHSWPAVTLHRLAMLTADLISL